MNAASYALDGALAPGVIFALFGTELTNSGTEVAQQTPLPTRLAGARVLVNGVATPLFYASPDQINGQFPVEFAGLASAQMQVEVTTGAGTVTSAAVTVSVAATSPGFFTLDQNGRGPAAILRNSNSTLICPSGRADCSANPVLRGEAIEIFLTGLGQVTGPWSSGTAAAGAFTTVATPVVTIGGTVAELIYSGLAPGFIGLYQVNVFVSREAPLGDNVPLRLTIEGKTHEVTIAVGSPGGSGGALPSVPINAIATVPGNPTTILAGTAGAGVLRSTDGGRTWTAPLPSANFVRLIAVDPANPLTAYVASSEFFKSTDGGVSWNRAGEVRLTFSLAIDPASPATLYAGTNGGVFKSTDGAASWTASGSGLTDPFVTSLVIDRSNPSTLYAGTVAADETGGGVFKSTNGGVTWVRSSAGLPNTRVDALVIDPASPSTLYAGTGGGAFKSTNAGATWTVAGTGLPAMLVYGLVIDPVTPSTLYARGSRSGVFKTTDGGANWTTASNGLPALAVQSLAIDPTNPATLYVGLNNGNIFRSTDRAATWQLLGQ